jgi:hypothetical protein
MKVMILLGSCFIFFITNGQPKFPRFNDKGLMKDSLPSSPVSPNYQIDLSAKTMASEQVQKLKSDLSYLFQRSMDNLQDKSLNLWGFYNKLWGANFSKDLLSDLKELKNYLEKGTYTRSHIFRYTPSPTELDLDLFNQEIYKTDMKVEEGMRKITLEVTDPVNHWLLSYLNTTFNTLKVGVNWNRAIKNVMSI